MNQSTFNSLHSRATVALAKAPEVPLPPCPSPRCTNVPSVEVGFLQACLMSAMQITPFYDAKKARQAE